MTPLIIYSMSGGRPPFVDALAVAGARIMAIDEAFQYSTLEAEVVLFRCPNELDLYGVEVTRAHALAWTITAGRILNHPAAIARAARKWQVYDILGDLCPQHVMMPTIHELNAFSGDLAREAGLPFVPFILRPADGYAGRGMEIVKSEQEIAGAHQRFSGATTAKGFRWMAVEFLRDTEIVQDRLYYARTRVYVACGTILGHVRAISDGWVNDGECATVIPEGLRADAEDVMSLYAMRDSVAQAAICAGSWLGVDSYAVDIMEAAGGRVYVVDVNPCYHFVANPQYFPESMHAERAAHAGRLVEIMRQAVHK
jgi:glutathione synthase/RimK-type ligase-like ATP-grasp enzyme